MQSHGKNQNEEGMLNKIIPNMKRGIGGIPIFNQTQPPSPKSNNFMSNRI